jgi:phosphatidylserine/phosphatidylglycerophosphate/cardiolipin synthase-like enzyme
LFLIGYLVVAGIIGGFGFSALAAAGVDVRTYAASASLYIHAKVIVADAGYAGEEMFLGSQNFSVTSLLDNRELGIITKDPGVIGAVAAILKQDAAGGAVWR